MQARRDEEAPKMYKEKHGGETQQQAKEEQKKEEVFKFDNTKGKVMFK